MDWSLVVLLCKHVQTYPTAPDTVWRASVAVGTAKPGAPKDGKKDIERQKHTFHQGMFTEHGIGCRVTSN